MADGEVIVEVKAETGDFDKNLRKAKTQAKEFDKSVTTASSSGLKRFSESTKEASSAASKLKARVKQAGDASKRAADDVKKNSEETKKLAAAKRKATAEAKRFNDGLKRSAEQSANFRNKLQGTSKEALTASQSIDKLKNSVSKTSAESNKAASATERLSKSTKKTSRESQKLGDKIKKTTRETEKFNSTVRKGKAPLTRYQLALKDAATNAALLSGPLGGIASRLTILSNITNKNVLTMAKLAIVYLGVKKVMTKVAGESEKMQTAFFRTEAIIRATGSTAGFTAKEIRQMSREIALSTLASTEGVEKAAGILLTFRKVQGDTFREALELSQDLASAGIGALATNAKGLGKALQDPITGLELLTRQGSLAKDEQKAIGDAFKRTGDLAQAQKSILEALRVQVGGTAQREARGLAGAYDTLGQRVDEFFQAIGDAGVLEVLTEFVRDAASAVKDLTPAFSALGAVIGDVFTRIAGVIKLAGNVLTAFLRSADITFLRVKVAAQNMAAGVASSLNSIGLVSSNVSKALEASAQGTQLVINGMVKDVKGDLSDIGVAINRILTGNIEKLEQVEEAQRKLSATTSGKNAIDGKQQKKIDDTIEGLRKEIAVLEKLGVLIKDASLSTKEFADAKERLTLLTNLGISALSKEGQEITKLLALRRKLTDPIENIQAERSRTRSNRAELVATAVAIRAADMLSEAVGKSEEEIRKAKVATAAYLIEQEKLAEAFKKQESITSAQAKSIRAQAESLAELRVKLEEVETARQKALDAEETANSKRLEFQETIASGLASAIFEADSFSDSLKKMVLNLSRAIVEAKILQAIQFSMGTDTGGAAAGGGNAIGGLLNKAFSGITSIFSPTETVAVKKLHQGGFTGQTVNSPVSNFISAPRFHDGLKPDEFPAILQQGEEVIPKDQVGGRGRGDRTVNLFVTTPDANSFRASKRQVSRMLRQQTAAT